MCTFCAVDTVYQGVTREKTRLAIEEVIPIISNKREQGRKLGGALDLFPNPGAERSSRSGGTKEIKGLQMLAICDPLFFVKFL